MIGFNIKIFFLKKRRKKKEKKYYAFPFSMFSIHSIAKILIEDFLRSEMEKKKNEKEKNKIKNFFQKLYLI